MLETAFENSFPEGWTGIRHHSPPEQRQYSVKDLKYIYFAAQAQRLHIYSHYWPGIFFISLLIAEESDRFGVYRLLQSSTFSGH